MTSEDMEFIPHYETSDIPPDVDCLPVWAFPHLYQDKWYPGKEEDNMSHYKEPVGIRRIWRKRYEGFIICQN